MKIIFLDIDGVLTTARTEYRRGDAYCVGNLNAITGITKAQIVITSTRRINPTKLYKDLYDWRVLGNIMGETPELDEVINGVVVAANRDKEIETWLKYRSEVIESFIVIDDDLSGVKEFENRLILTNREYGLIRSDVEKAIGLLNTNESK